MTAVGCDGDDDDPVDPSPFLCVLFDPDDHVLSADHEVDLGDHWLGRNSVDCPIYVLLAIAPDFGPSNFYICSIPVDPVLGPDLDPDGLDRHLCSDLHDRADSYFDLKAT